MTRLGLIINPTSGKGNGLLHGNKALDALREAGANLMDLSAKTYDLAFANGRAAIDKGQIDGLVVAGGDGMVHLGVNLCAGTDVTLGIIPCGTGNDAARTLGLPVFDGGAAAQVVLGGNSDRFDLGLGKSDEGSFHFFGSLSAGFDAVVAERANKWKWPKGPSRYVLAMLRELATFKPLQYSAVVDGVERKIEAMLCAVANSRSFGGGMLIAPEASVQDGELDLFVVHPLSRPAFLKMFPKVYTGGHVTHPAVEIVRTKSVSLDAGNIPTYADGEFVGKRPLQIEIAPNAIKIFVA
jgi:diacylglycerol kinase (ATP)